MGGTIKKLVCISVYIYEEMAEEGVKLYQRNGQIVVEGAEGGHVMMYDVFGRLLATRRDEGNLLRFDVPIAGVYLVRVGNAPARRGRWFGDEVFYPFY